jgi:hypothetical protein
MNWDITLAWTNSTSMTVGSPEARFREGVRRHDCRNQQFSVVAQGSAEPPVKEDSAVIMRIAGRKREGIAFRGRKR